MRPLTLRALLPLALVSAACASGGSVPATNNRDRVIMTTESGQVLRQSVNPNAHMTFQAPVATVWTAVQAAYADIGIEANTADRASNRYGVQSYTFPKRLKGTAISTLFSCGSSMTGPVVDQGRVTADVVTSLAATGGATDATVFIDAVVNKSDGSSSGPITCASTGQLELMLRDAIQKRLNNP